MCFSRKDHQDRCLLLEHVHWITNNGRMLKECFSGAPTPQRLQKPPCDDDRNRPSRDAPPNRRDFLKLRRLVNWTLKKRINNGSSSINVARIGWFEASCMPAAFLIIKPLRFLPRFSIPATIPCPPSLSTQPSTNRMLESARVVRIIYEVRDMRNCVVLCWAVFVGLKVRCSIGKRIRWLTASSDVPLLPEKSTYVQK